MIVSSIPTTINTMKLSLTFRPRCCGLDQSTHTESERHGRTICESFIVVIVVGIEETVVTSTKL